MSQNNYPQNGQGYYPQNGQEYYPQNGQGYYPQNGQGYYPPGGYQNPYPNIKSPLIWSILSMIFCCWPLGLVSIIYATQVNSLLSIGAFQAAQENADKAKMWAWLSFFSCLLVVVIYIIILAFAAIMSESID